MYKALIAVAAVVSCVAAAPQSGAGPHGPYSSKSCAEAGELYADKKSMCWYHECVADSNGYLSMIPRRCALGSRISYNYIFGLSNPCTINYDSDYGYECERTQESVNGPPACFSSLVCENGGTRTFESDKCWCVCPPSWNGNSDCSKPTMKVVGLPESSNICIDGKPQSDWCKLAGGCLNGGSCFNQCDTFYCLCPDHKNYNYKAKRCEY